MKADDILKPVFAFGLLLLLSCASPQENSEQENSVPEKPEIVWTDPNETGFLTLDQLNVLMKDQNTFFKEEGGLNSENGKDTVGYFIRKEKFLWIIMVGYADVFSVRYMCCEKSSGNTYSIIKSELGDEILGECPFEWKKYLQNAGSYMIIERLAHGSGYCGNFPQIFKLDGTEINTSDLNFTYWGCDESSEISYCRRTDIAFLFEDDYLQTQHSVDIMREDDRIIRKRQTYNVRYVLDGLNLLTKDTVHFKELAF